MGPEPTAPLVTAVVVTCRAGTWFDDTLKSLAEQDYPQLSVLVVEVGDDQDLAARVTKVLPAARLVWVPGGTGFTEAANRGMEMVDDEVAHVLLCHDDMVLAPDAVRLLLVEAYRSNAGLICPKCVCWEAPDRLLSVGMGADRLGVTHPLVDPGELDQGQHDAVREVFVAPGGAVLVRTDLWRALGGFNTSAGGPGDDLEISWRAQLAGARVVVAPQAVCRHLQASTRGMRETSPATVRAPGGAGPPGDGTPLEAGPGRAGDRALRERQRLRALWTCYGPFSLVLVAPAVVFFAVAESGWALFHGRSARDVTAPFVALVRSFARPRRLWADRRRAQRIRRTSDLALQRSQSRGSARLRAAVRLRLDRDRELVWAMSRTSAASHASASRNGVSGIAGPEGGAGTGGLPTAGGSASAAPERGGARRLGWSWTVATGCAVLLVLLVGSRNLLGQDLPVVGQLPAVGAGPATWWHLWWSGPGPGGLAWPASSSPGLLFGGLVAALALGSASTAVRLLVLGPLVLGPLGTYVETRRFGSQRGRLVAVVLYAALPVGYNALAQGHWPGLVSYAAAPWLVGGLCRLGGEAPYPLLRWRSTWPRLVALSLGLAVASSFAPATLLLAPVVGAAFLVGSVLVGRYRCGVRLFCASVAVAALAFVALAPWSLSEVRSWPTFVGPTSGTFHALDLEQVLRLQSGPFGGEVFGWALIAAAALPLFIGRSWRLAWAGRLWVAALVFMALAWAGSMGYLPVPTFELLLAPAGAALVFAVALGVASVELDLSGYRFGWRQVVPAVCTLAALAAAVPVVPWVATGQWDLPASGAEGAYAFPPGSQAGDYRVLWLGAPGSLPLGTQGAGGGMAFATALDGLPSAGQLWAPGPRGLAPALVQDLTWANDDETTALGHLLAPLAIRYVVVPVGGGVAPSSTAEAVAARALSTLYRQVDLVPVGIDPSYEVLANTAWAPLLSVFRGSAGPAELGTGDRRTGYRASWAAGYRLQQAQLRPLRTVQVGTSSTSKFVVRAPSAALVLYGAVPAASWRVTVNGHDVVGHSVEDGGTWWSLPVGRDVVAVSSAGSFGRHVADLVMVVIWVLALFSAVTRLHIGAGGQPAPTEIELRTTSGPASEIDWSDLLDGENVG
jgi:GT2 family glycosyltransferase